MSRLVVEGVRKHFGHRAVVDGVGLDVGAGEVVGLLGPNGAGKTTSFYMICGLVPADGGAVFIDGRDVTALPMHARARLGLGYLAQEPSVFRKLTARENLLGVLELRPGLDAEEREARAGTLLAELGIAHLRDSIAMSLSGGERRRLEIARALVLEPRYMLLDEPFAGVDPIAVGDIKAIVRHLRDRGIGVLITDHNVRETLDICDRAYIISHGQVLAQGAPRELVADARVRDVYLGEGFSL